MSTRANVMINGEEFSLSHDGYDKEGLEEHLKEVIEIVREYSKPNYLLRGVMKELRSPDPMEGYSYLDNMSYDEGSVDYSYNVTIDKDGNINIETTKSSSDDEEEEDTKESMNKMTFKDKYGTLTKRGNRAGIEFSKEEIASWIKEPVEGSVIDGYPESIYTTAGKSEFILDNYTVAFWLKATMNNGSIERNVVQVTKHPEETICIGRVASKKDFENICNTLLVYPCDYGLDYDSKDKTLYTTAGKVVLQNIFFSNVEDMLDYQKAQEEEEEPSVMDQNRKEEIPEVDFSSLLEEEPIEEEKEEMGGGLPPLEEPKKEEMAGGELPPLV